MESIAKHKVNTLEECKSPFKSPAKGRLKNALSNTIRSTENSPSPVGERELMRAQRRESKRKAEDEREAREKAPPK